MANERWNKAQRLFEEARKLPAAERAAFLDRGCGDDAELRASVESLLARAGEAGEEVFMLTRATPTTGSTLFHGESADLMIGQRIGQYRIKDVIGSGGMGTVYLAVQENPRRNVALKIMKKGIASPSALRRFEFEAQLLGRLRHPGIAQVYEAGTHDDGEGGVPYFAMEYVPSAVPITKYADKKRLDLRRLLELFTKVCEAVAHGHQKGIVHRDLKPSNILVDSSGQPRVIDFGVARSTDSDMAVTTVQTDLRQLIGTLQYMSPEQCGGDSFDIDTASDVYALGVVLYELLCNQPPYNLSREVIPAAVKIIQEQEPKRPSTFNRTLRGDVETIVLKALEKERARRYGTAAELGGDLRRYLNDGPVVARPPGVVDAVRRLARQHKTATAGIAGALGVFFVAMVVVLVLLFSARAANNRALDAARKLWHAEPGISQQWVDVEAAHLAGLAMEEARQAEEAVSAGNTGLAAEKYVSAVSLLQDAWRRQVGLALNIRMVSIPAGEFMMGTDQGADHDEIDMWLAALATGDRIRLLRSQEVPQHRVTVRSFLLSATEVTQRQYILVVHHNPSFYRDNPARPVESVSWIDAVQFCNQLSLRERRSPRYVERNGIWSLVDGTGYRLPTEAEWEYACRAGTETAYSFGEANPNEHIWHRENTETTRPVASKKPNPLGLFDMHGNVREWCEDSWHSDYRGAPETQDAWREREFGLELSRIMRVQRGGGIRDNLDLCRSASRYPDRAVVRDLGVGFRVALDVEEADED